MPGNKLMGRMVVESLLLLLVVMIFAGTYDGIFRSTNDGQDWIGVNTGLSNTIISSFTVSESNIFVGTGDGIFLSTNNGLNWIEMSLCLTNKFISSLANNGTYVFAVLIAGFSFQQIMEQIGLKQTQV